MISSYQAIFHGEELQRSPELRKSLTDVEVQGWDGLVLGNFSDLACQGADSRGIFALWAEKCILRIPEPSWWSDTEQSSRCVSEL